MRKALVIGLGAVLLSAGCGDASSEESVAATVPSVTEGTPAAEPEVSSEPETTEPGAVTSLPPTSAEEVNTVDPSVLEPVTTKPVETVPQPPPSEPEGESVPPPAIDHPNPQVVTAMTDLVARLGVAPDAIEVVLIEEVTWPDGSVGCPQPGMRYTQALVNGSRIVLRVGGIDYQYNSGGARGPFYCMDPSDPVTGGDYGDI